MPTIRRPAWRPRKIFGHAVEAQMSRSNLALECDAQFQMANLTDAARATILKLSLTAWFIRCPKAKETFATLIWLDGHCPRFESTLDEAKRKANGKMKLTSDEDSDNFWNGRYHYSFVDGKAKAYMNANPEFLWDAVRDYLERLSLSKEDSDALAGL